MKKSSKKLALSPASQKECPACGLPECKGFLKLIRDIGSEKEAIRFIEEAEETRRKERWGNFRKHIEDEINSLKKYYDAGMMDGPLVLDNFFTNLNLHLRRDAPTGYPITDAKWMRSIVKQEMKTKFKKSEENAHLGITVASLIAKGSSRIQAIRATAEWNACSETKVRNEHIRYKKLTQFNTEQEPDSFESYYCLLKNKKPFPSTFPKARKAFAILKPLADIWYKEHGAWYEAMAKEDALD